MKQEILQTSLQQFLMHGIHNMTIQKLIEPLGISTKTFYKYFKSKEGLLEEALLFYFTQRFQMLQDMSENQHVVHLLFNIWYIAVERENEGKQLFFQDLLQYYPELERKIALIKGKTFTRQFSEIIQKGIKEGVIIQHVLPEVVLEGISVLYASIIQKGHFKSFGISTYDLLLNTIAIYIRGCCTHQGKQALDEHILTLKTTGSDKVLKEKISSVYSYIK